MSKSVVISDEDNYRMELIDMRRGFRKAIEQAPDYLRQHMTCDGKNLLTDLRTLWSLTQDSVLSNLKPIRRLKRDLQW